MGWLSSLLHDIGTPSQWFSSPAPAPVAAPDNSAAINAQTEALKTQTASAQAAAQAALKAQTDANLIAAAAAVPASDSESARRAADQRRRQLMTGSSFGIGLPDKLGAPPVGFRLLSGQ